MSEVEIGAMRDRLGLNRPYVLFVGTIEPRKNLSGVIAAVAGLAGRDIDLVIAGPEGWNEDLDARLAVLDGSGIGVPPSASLPPSDLLPLYAGAAVFCFPSIREGFGMPVLDAMAHGAPVVTSRGTATEEVAGDAGILADPLDPSAIGVALEAVLTIRRADRMSRDGNERAVHLVSHRGLTAAVTPSGTVTDMSSAPLHVGEPAVVGPGVWAEARSTRCALNALTDGGDRSSEVGPPIQVTLFALRQFAEAHPDLAARYPVVAAADTDGHSRAERVAREATWLPRALERHGVDLVHHAGGVVPPGPLSARTPSVLTIPPAGGRRCHGSAMGGGLGRPVGRPR
ncbi:MAG: glycosyltransferase [Microthrixaceae bacterium]|nr:glycosyltransferase [Microthrixaceae bacterium]